MCGAWFPVPFAQVVTPAPTKEQQPSLVAQWKDLAERLSKELPGAVALLQAAHQPPKIGKVKPATPKTPNTMIEEVAGEELTQLVDEHEHVAVLFYEKMDKATKKALAEMEEMETADLDVVIVR